MNKEKENRLIDTEKRPVVTRGEGGGGLDETGERD